MRRKAPNPEITLEPDEPTWLRYRSTGFVENWRLRRLREWTAFKKERIRKIHIDYIKARHQKHLDRR